MPVIHVQCEKCVNTETGDVEGEERDHVTNPAESPKSEAKVRNTQTIGRCTPMRPCSILRLPCTAQSYNYRVQLNEDVRRKD